MGAAGPGADAKATRSSRVEATASRLIARQMRRRSSSVLGLFCIKFCQCVFVCFFLYV